MGKIVFETGYRTRPWTSPVRWSRDELDNALERQGTRKKMNTI
jgi:hypothetical protein